MPLVERDGEVSAIADAIGRAAGGAGGAIFISGVPGVGKTVLAAEAVAQAEAAGMAIFRARADELEMGLGFCVMRDLLVDRLRELDPADEVEVLDAAAGLAAGPLGLAGIASVDFGQALYGLYWLMANLADRGPLALIIDDAHWADDQSLSALAYIARRISGHPILLVVASRPAGGELHEAHLMSLRSTSTVVLDLRPLSVDGVGQVIHATLDAPATPEFAEAFFEASGGNPLLVIEGLRDLAEQAVEPTPYAVRLMGTLSPRSLAASIERRVARCGTHGATTAKAVGILGPNSDIRRITSLTGLGPEDVGAAVSALRREGVLGPDVPLDFIHPLVRSAMSSLVTEPEAGLLHRQAARLLAADGDDAVASHLLRAARTGDPWVVEWLDVAAARATANGSPGNAAQFLRRAIDEPPPPSEVPALTLKLGRAELASQQFVAAERHLRDVIELADGAPIEAEASVELSRVLTATERALDGISMLRRALADPSLDKPTRMALEAELATASFFGASNVPAIDRLESVVASADGSSLGECWVRAAFAYGAAGTGRRPAQEVLDVVHSVRPEVSPVPPHLQHVLAVCLLACGTYDAGLSAFDAALETCRVLGDATFFTLLSGSRAHAALRRGMVDVAEADARAALEAEGAVHGYRTYSAACVVLALLEKDRLDEAETMLHAEGLSDTTEPALVGDTWFYAARGRVHKLRGRLSAALADFERSRDVAVPQAFTNPSFTDWHADLALTHAALGATDLAKELADADLSVSRAFGAPREIGRGLRVLGLLEGNNDGLDLLAEAVAVLDASEARLDLAESRVELGAALRRSGRRSDAIKHLTVGLDLAAECGSRALANRARSELRVAGARPRRERLNGIDALTASERRVASMAAAGQSNPEIAQALFVTRNTVEAHLTSVFRKLGIEGRRELAAALATAPR